MLEAIKTILDIPTECEAKEASARVDSARIMLTEIIKGMKEQPSKPVEVVNFLTTSASQGSEEVGFKCTKDSKDGTFKIIGTPPEDQKIMLDGVTYHWKDAIGKSFKVGKIL